MNTTKELRVLLIIDQCNPEMPSVPLLAYQFFKGISQLADVTLVTHERNKQALEQVKGNQKVIYIDENPIISNYYRLAARLTSGKKGINWPLINALSYFVYAEFNHKVYQQFSSKVLQGNYDIVHVITPILPRYPVAMIKACQNTPFILGPVNGGVPFPQGFQEIARKEFAYFNFLRRFSFLIPGYKETYKKADRVLVGSTYTLNLIKKMFKLADDKVQLFYENGIPEDFFVDSERVTGNQRINLLFVGRLVPYKGADIVIESISKLNDIKERIQLTIVGDGPERENLNKQVQELDLSNIVSFTGWINQSDTRKFYQAADIFCFPSIREFGGAVVLEAMACGLPCIVADNGGIAEYVTKNTGFKIPPRSREYLVQEMTNHIRLLVENQELRKNMSAQARARAKQFAWGEKAREVIRIYEEVRKK